MSDDHFYLHRCLQLAALGLGRVQPNPMVGSVLVAGGSIIGEGYHEQYGEAHAEVNAINEAQRHVDLFTQSTLYVSLEPCSHWGKTAPCVDLIIEKKIPRVVVGCIDSNPKVSGKGIAMLQNAGIEVEINGVLEAECRALNKRFFTFHEQKRPYIILKFAQTNDRFIAQKNYDSKWISNEWSRKIAHKWRTEEQAILVGTATAQHDNPSLTAREWQGKNPMRILIDRQLQININHNIFDNEAQTLVVTEQEKSSVLPNVRYLKMDFQSSDFLEILLSHLHSLDIQSLIVEGGSQTIGAFVGAGLWDEARIFTSTTTHFGQGIAAPKIVGKWVSNEWIDGDLLQIFSPIS